MFAACKDPNGHDKIVLNGHGADKIALLNLEIMLRVECHTVVLTLI